MTMEEFNKYLRLEKQMETDPSCVAAELAKRIKDIPYMDGNYEEFKKMKEELGL